MINDILRGVGLTSLARPWLADADTALAGLMLITIWQWTGLFFILYYAAMTQIDPELLEAARLDRGSLREDDREQQVQVIEGFLSQA